MSLENSTQEEYKGITIHFPVSLHRRIKVHCAKNGLKMKDYIVQTLDNHLKHSTNEE